MARPLRITFEDAFYHVTSRGNERKKIFLSHRDYEKFLSYFAESLLKFGVILHVFVLMPNHHHLLVETPKANLSVFMHSLNTAYSTYFNLKRRRVGHLFQGRFKANLIDVDPYLLELSRYIHLSPVWAGITEDPKSYPYSSYRAYIDPKHESLIFRDLLWSMVVQKEENDSRNYRKFVESALKEKISNPLEKAYGGLILGGKRFIKEVLDRLKDQDIQKKEVARRRFLGAGTLDIEEIIDLVSNRFKVSREQVQSGSLYKGYAVYLTRRHTPFSNREIGRYFGDLSYSAVTKVGTRIKDRMRKDTKLSEKIVELEKELSRVKN